MEELRSGTIFSLSFDPTCCLFVSVLFVFVFVFVFVSLLKGNFAPTLATAAASHWWTRAKQVRPACWCHASSFSFVRSKYKSVKLGNQLVRPAWWEKKRSTRCCFKIQFDAPSHLVLDQLRSRWEIFYMKNIPSILLPLILYFKSCSTALLLAKALVVTWASNLWAWEAFYEHGCIFFERHSCHQSSIKCWNAGTALRAEQGSCEPISQLRAHAWEKDGSQGPWPLVHSSKRIRERER